MLPDHESEHIPRNIYAVGGKSKREPHDIRKLLIALEAKKARVYPKGDLVPLKRTLGNVIGGER